MAGWKERRLLVLIPPHEAYVEVFAGSAKLLFAKEPTAWEVINDVNGDLINFFRVVKHRAAELTERFQLECAHRDRFRELKLAPSTPDEIERALRFAYLTWYSFGSKGEHFAACPVRSMESQSIAVHRSLSGVRDLLAATAGVWQTC